MVMRLGFCLELIIDLKRLIYMQVTFERVNPALPYRCISTRLLIRMHELGRNSLIDCTRVESGNFIKN